MDDNLLLRAAVVCAVIGVAALYFISGSIGIQESSINKITSGASDSDNEVLVMGKVARITDRDSFVIIDIEKTEKIPVFVFKDDPMLNLISINAGDDLEVRGSVGEYNMQKQIIASEMRLP